MLTAAQRQTARPLPIFKEILRPQVRDGSKTQTRRLFRTQPWDVLRPDAGEPFWPYGFKLYAGSTTQGDMFKMRCPYGKPGDIAYLREPLLHSTGRRCARYCDEPSWLVSIDVPNFPSPDGSEIAVEKHRELLKDNGWESGAWTSMTMPRWAARKFVRITSIRVELLQEISCEDAIAEGVERYAEGWKDYEVPRKFYHSARNSFASLWGSINGCESWAANPWVWVVEWEAVEC